MFKPDEILNLIRESYGTGEPILTEDLDSLFSGVSRRTLFSYIDSLIKGGSLRRYETGIYYIPVRNEAGESALNPLKVIARKYLGTEGEPDGFWSGATLDNSIGLTEQVPTKYEVVTNNTGTAQKTVKVGGFLECIIRKSKIPVDADNIKAQQLLDILSRRRPKQLSKEQIAVLQGFARGLSFSNLMSMSASWPQKTTRRVLESEACGVFA